MPRPYLDHLRKIEPKYLLGLGSLVVVFALVNLTALTIAIKYDGRTFPGLRVAGQLVGGLSEEQLIERLNQRGQAWADSNLVISASGKQVQTKAGTIATVDAQKTAAEAMDVGRQGNVVDIWKDRARALLRQKDLPMEVEVNKAQLDKLIAQVKGEAELEAADAKIEVKDGQAVVNAERTGKKVDSEQLRRAVLGDVAKLSDQPIEVAVTEVKPKVTTADLSVAKSETDNALKSPVTMKWNGKSWAIDAGKIATLLSYSTADAVLATAQVGDSQISVGKIRKLNSGSEPTGNLEPHLHYDSSRLGAILGPIVNAINQPATNPKLAFVNGQLQVAAGSGEGREVDEELLAARVMAAFNGQGPRTVDIPVKVSTSGIDIAHLESLGIKELLGKGQSFYTGSIPGRNTNIAVAAGRVNGALVAPGQVFSLYQQIGEVIPAYGYVTSYVIIGHRTELGLGGGVCQVSTTLFRAALNAGLPIVERHPHAYRVHYYEQNSGAGLDATVYFPSVDFKFRNDTGHWILVQTVNDPAHASLTFEIYGTSDGRVTNISTPQVTNVQPPPAPLYQDDPTLAKGITKQVDWAVEGADASFTRTVTRGGQEILHDTYYSKYAPWQAIYMVGAKG